MIKDQYKEYLEPESLVVIKTGTLILHEFAQFSGNLDFAPLIICSFKVLEIEVNKKVFEGFRKQCRCKTHINAKPFKDDYLREIDAMTLFLREGKAISLGEMMLVLRYLRNVSASPEGDPYSRLKMFLRRSYRSPYYFYGKQMLAKRIQEAIIQFRNPAVHTKTLGSYEYRTFNRLFYGTGRKEGLLNLTIKCLMPRGELP